MQQYVEHVCRDIVRAEAAAVSFRGDLDQHVDTVYLGGGTPTTLAPEHLSQLFYAVRSAFSVTANAEITVECAPGTLSPEILDALLRNRVNRVSFGVQSFVEAEVRAVGRTHTRDSVLSDIDRLRAAGIHNISVDLIAGLPHQTAASWRESLEVALATNVPHISVYMLEVDEDSRLGREVIAGGVRYHAHDVPDDDRAAEFYSAACERFEAAGIQQYEISNFARPGFESKHNLKYWTRQPYLGFGLDAHSMLPASNGPANAVRFSTTDDLTEFLPSPSSGPHVTRVAKSEAIEEEFFLGLRLNRGIDLSEISEKLNCQLPVEFVDAVAELTQAGLLYSEGRRIRLMPRGRLLSNEVFARFIHLEGETAAPQLASC
jgi:oxygen-independent coproporphyrinogen-3 oxidase